MIWPRELFKVKELPATRVRQSAAAVFIGKCKDVVLTPRRCVADVIRSTFAHSAWKVSSFMRDRLSRFGFIAQRRLGRFCITGESFIFHKQTNKAAGLRMLITTFIHFQHQEFFFFSRRDIKGIVRPQFKFYPVTTHPDADGGHFEVHISILELHRAKESHRKTKTKDKKHDMSPHCCCGVIQVFRRLSSPICLKMVTFWDKTMCF